MSRDQEIEDAFHNYVNGRSANFDFQDFENGYRAGIEALESRLDAQDEIIKVAKEKFNEIYESSGDMEMHRIADLALAKIAELEKQGKGEEG